MKLHEDKKMFQDAVRTTAQMMEIPPNYVEKDYWVTYVLWLIFNDEELKEYTVFKGGTALSKCYKIIQRFSEDIDLTVLKTEGENDNQLKKKIGTISKKIKTLMPEIEILGITNKKGKIRKTAHTFPITQNHVFGQVRDKIIVETSCLGSFEPFQTTKVSSYIFEMMESENLTTITEKHDLRPFEIKVLDIKITLCEKIMSLVRFSYSKNYIDELKMKVRHTYDIYQLLQLDELKDFFLSSKFEHMLNKVGKEDMDSYKNNNRWLDNHPKDAIVFKDAEIVWNQIKETYQNDFKLLVFGKLPDEQLILEILTIVGKRLQSINWNLDS